MGISVKDVLTMFQNNDGLLSFKANILTFKKFVPNI